MSFCITGLSYVRYDLTSASNSGPAYSILGFAGSHFGCGTSPDWASFPK